MSKGFKKSLFGFNCDEVIAYIEKAHKTFKERELLLNENIESLNNNLSATQERERELTEENFKLSAELTALKEKYAEIERLSENIGKLYLVAQTNAKTIMDNAAANKQASETEVSKNLSLIENAQGSFDSLKENIIKSSYDFVAEIDGILQSLEDSKAKIEQNNIADENAKKDFEKVYQSIVK